MALPFEELMLRVIGLGASLLYLAVAWVLGQRKVPRPARGAHVGFIFWWSGLGVLGIVTFVLAFVPIGTWGLGAARVILYGLVAGILAMLAGLAHYLAFLYTGRRWPLAVIAGFYTVLMALFIWSTESQQPFIDAAGQIGYAAERGPGDWIDAAIGLGLVGPALIAALAYMLLYRQAETRTTKYRIVMVSLAFVLWFGFSAGSTVVTTGLEWETTPIGIRFVNQLLGLLAASLVLMAYVPPGMLRRRGIESVFDQPHRSKQSIFGEQRSMAPIGAVHGLLARLGRPAPTATLKTGPGCAPLPHAG